MAGVSYSLDLYIHQVAIYWFKMDGGNGSHQLLERTTTQIQLSTDIQHSTEATVDELEGLLQAAASEPMEEYGGADLDSRGVQIFCRVRPFNTRELRLGSSSAINYVSENAVKVMSPHYIRRDPFAFDAIFKENAKQAEIFERVAMPAVHNLMQGYNATVFAYGQTGAGKVSGTR